MSKDVMQAALHTGQEAVEQVQYRTVLAQVAEHQAQAD
jgi:hypothetical protein